MEPITREEMYLAAAAGYDVDLPSPITRKEVFLAKLAGMEVETPVPFTRRERFLEAAAVAANRAVIEPLTITENGTYAAPEGVDGYNPVTVNVPAPEIKLQDMTITENGEYTADNGFVGLGKVTVEVAGSGGGSLPAGVYWVQRGEVPYLTAMTPILEKDKMLYWGIYNTDTKYSIYELSDGAYTKIKEEVSSVSLAYSDFAEHNGSIHIMKEYGNHISFDENWNSTTHTTVSMGTASIPLLFSIDGILYVKRGSSSLHKWIEDTDTWEAVDFPGLPTLSYHWSCKDGRNIYIVGYGNIYKVDWDNKTCATIATGLPSSSGQFSAAYFKNCIYFKKNYNLYKYDLNSNVWSQIGLLPSRTTYLYISGGDLCAIATLKEEYSDMKMYEVTE